MINQRIREEEYSSIEYRDYVDVSVSDLFLTISNYSGKPADTKVEMIMLKRQEALDLLDFLKENEDTIRSMEK